ncbi:MAG: tetratricopeptide repeat protein, partial [Candidatus Latescibacteria bacterium]|nr:tetratricopeptide repeat protein [Candidatus Latescibacterota bacterium]
ERAADEFEQLIDAQPTVIEHHIRLAELLIEGEKKPGIALGQSERLHRAEELLRRSLELEPANPHPLWSLGMLYARQGRYLEAVPLFERLLAIAPRDYQAHLFLGHLYKRTGRAADATARFDAFSRGQRAHRLEKTARREFESKVEEIFGG